MDAESNWENTTTQTCNARAPTHSYRNSTLKIVYRYLLACICEWNTKIILLYSIFDFDGVNMRHYKQPPPPLSLSIVRLPAGTLVRPDYRHSCRLKTQTHTLSMSIRSISITSEFPPSYTIHIDNTNVSWRWLIYNFFCFFDKFLLMLLLIGIDDFVIELWGAMAAVVAAAAAVWHWCWTVTIRTYWHWCAVLTFDTVTIMFMNALHITIFVLSRS